MKAELNRAYVRRWHAKQRNPLGVIYMVINILTGETYVGSTTNSIKKRWWQHIAAANQGKTAISLYEAIRVHGKEAFIVEELYRCQEGDVLKEKEKEFIKEINPEYNKNLKNNGN